MAIRLIEEYPNRVGAPTADYPHGVPRNKSTPTATDGTPFEQSWFRDQEGFFQGLMETAGITPNGQPDTVLNSDYLDALNRVTNGVIEVDMSGAADVSLSTYQGRVAALKLTGALAADVDLIVPDTERMYWIIDETTGDFSVTVKTAAGTGVKLFGEAIAVRSDGTNVVPFVNGLDRRVIYVDTIDDLQALPTSELVDGQQVQVLEYYSGSGVGGGDFFWDSASTEADNGGTIIQPPGTATGRWKRFDKPSANLYEFGAVLDGVTDDSDALESAIAAKDIIEGFDGDCRFTRPIALNLNTKLEAINDKSSGNGYKTQFLFDPAAPAETTLASSATSTQDTLELTDATGFPSAGYAQIGDIRDCEYVEYTGKSGNTLTGVKRGWFGGTQGPTIANPGTDNEGTAQSSGAAVVAVHNAFYRDDIFAGNFGPIALRHAALDTGTKTPGRGNGIYLTYGAYTTVLNGTSLRGFERGAYVGRAYSSVFEKPVMYYCHVGAQVDIGNGAVVTASDSGQIGRDSSPVFNGAAWVFRGGEGACVVGGNHGNGGQNNPFVSDNHKNLTINGAYIEAAKDQNLFAMNGGSLSFNGGYIKEGNYLGATKTGGRIYINDVYARGVNYTGGFVVYDTDKTGYAEVRRHYDNDTQAYMPDRVIINRLEQPLANPLTSLRKWAKPQQVVNSTLTSGAAESILRVRNEVTSAEPDKGGAVLLKYMARTEYSSGIGVQSGSVIVAFSHRRSVTTVVDVTKSGDVANANTLSGTVTVNFGNTTPSGDEFGAETFEITVTATSNAGQAINFVAWYEEIPSDKEQMQITEL